MILMLDNYDSFTYNLVQYLYQLGAEVTVRRNDEMSLEEIFSLKPQAIVLSPGPGKPENAGIMNELVAAAAGKIPMLGVCLGHQAIGQVFGGKIVHAGEVMHGKISEVFHDGKGIFSGIANPVTAVRYHSLAIEKSSLPDVLEITAETSDGEIMGVRHKKFLIEGVQYHPESILSGNGKMQLANFLELAKKC